MRASKFLLAVALACLLCGCAGLPAQQDRPYSAAIVDAHTRLGALFAPGLAAHPGQSAFHPLQSGEDAFLARIDLIRSAQRSIDLQYYIYQFDDSGLALLDALLAAADRGVRVRLLLDDFHLASQEKSLAVVAAHPNVEVRVFNPFASRAARWFDLIRDFGRVNRRMHNKSMTADGQVAIVGGRNVGNEYFGARDELDFSDVDLFAAGPVVRDVAAEFDEYWNSASAYALQPLLGGPKPEKRQLQEYRVQLAGFLDPQRNPAHPAAPAPPEVLAALAAGELPLYWGAGELIYDRVNKVTLPVADRSGRAMERLLANLLEAKQELILVSPYFVPGRQGVRVLRDLVRRGVHVVVLTNSFAATDVQAVHAGYAAYREELLAAGVELYELKPKIRRAVAHGRKRILGGSSRTSLHAKAYMVDGRRLFVGSLNLDPRSIRLNTEMGIMADSEEMCAPLRQRFRERLPDVAYRVTLRDGRLAWTTREDDAQISLDAEPGMGWLQRLGQHLLRLLPVEEQL